MGTNIYLESAKKTIDNQMTINSINNLSSSTYGCVLDSLVGLDISQFCDFNEKNGEVMRYHMMRNDIQKSYMLDGMGSNAYANGDSYNDSTPIPEYSYSIGHSYNRFAHDIHNDAMNGVLITGENFHTTGYNMQRTNYFFDYDKGYSDRLDIDSIGANVSGINSNGYVNNNESLLFKTKKLFNANKIKSIISQFHTSGVTYNGQVRTSYGESHGRNLLTEQGEYGTVGKDYNGYDNPYCRVWTHHYTYDRLSKTMRAHNTNGDIKNSMNYWGEEFEWNNNDAGHTVDGTSYGEGEVYDYAWRGHHNQERRRQHSVLDETTGLVNITPKYNKDTGNIHTKSCMFSIENLAWKDYDPYSFEQALSWEQRGPMGGRIMWFPPYNLKVSETNTARWNSNEFIGRGEPVYTYTNSERTGTLSFTMLVDHPSSIDYASWHDKGEVHTDNDYLRYFAGCFETAGTHVKGVSIEEGEYGDVINNVNGQISANGGDNLLEVPTNLTDEYTKPVTIQGVEKEKKKNMPEDGPVTENETKAETNGPVTVEFYVFYPNNYSGYYDNQRDSEVDPILYLLMGNGAQKQPDGFQDLPLNEASLKNIGDGYEMSKAIGKKNYIQGHVNSNQTNKYQADVTKKWYYRIDCKVDGEKSYKVDNLKKENTIGQTLTDTKNYEDTCCLDLNSEITNINFSNTNKDKLYSFAEVAYAIYDGNDSTKNISKNIMSESGGNWFNTHQQNIEYLQKIFNEYKLSKIQVSGVANSHNNNTEAVNKQRNDFLAKQRGETVYKWLKEYKSDWSKTELSAIQTSSVENINGNDVNSNDAKLNRNAHVIMEFTSVETKAANQTNDNSGATLTDTTAMDQQAVKGELFIQNQHHWEKITELNIGDFLESSESSDNYIYVKDELDSVDTSHWEFVTTLGTATECNEAAGARMFGDKYRYEYSDTTYEYKDIVYWNRNFYYAKQDFKDQQSAVGRDTSVLSGTQIKEYHGFKWVKEEQRGEQIWNYYQQLASLPYFVEKQNGNGNADETNDGVIVVSEQQLLNLAKEYEPTNANTVEYAKYNYVTSLQDSELQDLRSSNIKSGDIIFNMCDELYYFCIKDVNLNYSLNDNTSSVSTTAIDFDIIKDEYFKEVETFTDFDTVILQKIAMLLCKDFDGMIRELFPTNTYKLYATNELHSEFQQIIKFGNSNITQPEFNLNQDFKNETIINADSTTNLKNVVDGYVYAQLESYLTSDEKKYLTDIGYNNNDVMAHYIAAYNLLNNIDKIQCQDEKGETYEKNVCTSPDQISNDMEQKSEKQNTAECVLWIDRGDGQLINECELFDKNGNLLGVLGTSREKALNKLRYDQEYHFYEKYMDEHPFVFNKLREKIKYFNPAFHSMTPEGFNGRLTFLNQCTRQGNTMTRSDNTPYTTANNLAFGRPPYCVLRLGDFYHQLIIIDSITYDFDSGGGLQWDLNTEGNGVQPMLCNVNISFKFIGGGDITGPVRRLQNAMSFNYYANTSFYDNRADRPEYEENLATMGGAGHNEMLMDKSYSYSPGMYDQEKQ